MTNSVIKMVQAIEADYGTVNCKEASNDPRLLYIHSMYKNEDQREKSLTVDESKIEKAQKLLDSENLPKYKIAEMAGYNKDYFGTLCVDGYLDDSKWYEHRRSTHNYKYYCDDKLVAEGTINQIAMKLGKSPSTIRGCMQSVYRKYKHEHTYRLVKVR
ncbi:helix-turn-helix transcriptional regulator [Companilactobacillus alimentarius]|uniref:helix-turn-helix transcriptional regulator n=1 Tax=Companilactobacillus alimentarius TaxID=1602 RepID=UPI0028B690E9|nr:hypothetical protein [Companilactobacillus alimentarius]MDT6953584.1 hypothetical protein [Companilactobacillus alimentarius]MDT6953660.1 hypothetical protein [Companilactobacillus alimentarius]